VFRDGELSISDAVRKGKAIWALDHDTLLKLRRQGVEKIGILNYDDNESYWTDLETYMDSKVAPPRDYRRRGGAVQRYLPFHAFGERRPFLA
jgi:hypothetical protein